MVLFLPSHLKPIVSIIQMKMDSLFHGKKKNTMVAGVWAESMYVCPEIKVITLRCKKYASADLLSCLRQSGINICNIWRTEHFGNKHLMEEYIM
ncbi:hypothetical protein GDO78_012499 [Eleutherodactylus coqui]|uniref:Uncharacterized protein n=1 Tax=Eleutherodactylus coqui TaxID=57060 RepID=A0A8J6EZ81_ELECQ|nr:hypothetical protein GDO78_012499 [Eleutherodactylus coqui]